MEKTQKQIAAELIEKAKEVAEKIKEYYNAEEAR